MSQPEQPTEKVGPPLTHPAAGWPHLRVIVEDPKQDTTRFAERVPPFNPDACLTTPRRRQDIDGMEDLVAHASVLVNASRRVVWTMLLRPDTIMKIAPVSEVIAPWSVGKRFAWAFDMLGKRTLVEGVVHRIEEAQLLEYEYGDPHSRDLLHRENVHRVSISLSDEGEGTRVSIAQTANINHAAQKHAEGAWRLALNHLKGLVERSSSQT